jgi:hypothetical protein
MSEAAKLPSRFLTETPAAFMSAGMTLISRRTSAVADFWRSWSKVREPADLMAVQLNFWTRLAEDYQAALAEGASNWAGARDAAISRPARLM